MAFFIVTFSALIWKEESITLDEAFLGLSLQKQHHEEIHYSSFIYHYRIIYFVYIKEFHVNPT
jgi:hypothetical protein